MNNNSRLLIIKICNQKFTVIQTLMRLHSKIRAHSKILMMMMEKFH